LKEWFDGVKLVFKGYCYPNSTMAWEDEELSEATLMEEIMREEEESAHQAAMNALNEDAAKSLTPFQEEIITTGSGIAWLILYTLAALFIIRAIQLIWESMNKMNALAKVNSVLSEARTLYAHKVRGPFGKEDGSTTNYEIKYCAEFEHRIEYDNFVAEHEAKGLPINKDDVKKILVKRAKEVLIRQITLEEDKVGMHKSWASDMVPMEVWNDYRDAYKQCEGEFKLLELEVAKHQLLFGRKQNIFEYANELIQFDRSRSNNYKRLRDKHKNNDESKTTSIMGKTTLGKRRKRPKKRFPKKK